MKNKKVLLINWGTETSVHILKECIELEGYDFYLACTSFVPKKIVRLFGKSKIVFCNPYDPVKLCEDVSQFIKEKKIKFDIVTTFFEMCVYQTAFLSDFLQINNRLPLKNALRTSVNKFLMRKKISEIGLRQPDFMRFNSNSIKKAYLYYKNLKTSAIIKPIHSGHSYGVRYIERGLNFENFKKLFIDANNDFLGNYDEWMRYETVDIDDFLIEKYIKGKIYSFDGVVKKKGVVDFIGCTEYELSEPPIMQQIGHTTPVYSLNLEMIREGKEYVKKIVSGLGLQFCGFHAEIKYFRMKPMLIEISGRLPGGVITKTYQDISSENIIDKFFSIFVDDKSKIQKNKDYFYSETMKIVFSDKKKGVVIDCPVNKEVVGKDFIYKIRSRRNGEKINVENVNPFGIWLYEIILKSKKLSSRKLVNKRDNLITNQNIKVIGDRFFGLNKLFHW